MSASEMLRAQLDKSHIANVLSNPAAPSTDEAMDPFRGLFEDAVVALRKVEDVDSQQSSGKVGDTIKPPTAKGSYYGDLSLLSSVRHTPYSSFAIGQVAIGSACKRSASDETNMSTPAKQTATIRTPNLSGKADKVSNWRDRSVSTPTRVAHDDAPAVIVTTPGQSTVPLPDTTPASAPARAGSEIMTIDSLFEKFGHGDGSVSSFLSSEIKVD